MRYEHVRRLSGVERFWLRLKVARLARDPLRRDRTLDVNRLSDRELRDIGLSRREDLPTWWRYR